MSPESQGKGIENTLSNARHNRRSQQDFQQQGYVIKLSFCQDMQFFHESFSRSAF